MLRHCDTSEPTLVLGDFNTCTTADTALLEAVRERFVDALMHCGKACVATYPTGLLPTSDPEMRIDHIFATDDVAQALRDAAVVEHACVHLASDHFPVIADFDLRPNESASL